MTLKAVVDNLDDVPAEFHGEYLEKDGKFFLDVDDTIKLHPSTRPLTVALENLKKEQKTTKTQLTEALAKAIPEGFDVDEWTQLKEEAEARKKDPNYKPPGDAEAQQRLKEQYEQRLVAAERKRLDEVAAEKAANVKLQAAIEGRVRREDLSQSLIKAGVAPEFHKAALSMLLPTVKVRREEGESDDFTPYVETDLGEVSVASYIESWSKSDEGKPFVPAPKGGGSQGSDKGTGNINPFTDANWNVTEQGKLARDKPELAVRMAQQAGTTLGGPRPVKRAA